MTKNKKKLISILLTGSILTTTVSNNIFVSATESQNIPLSKEEENKALDLFNDYDEKRNQERMEWLFEHKIFKKGFVEAVKEELEKTKVFLLDTLNIRFIGKIPTDYNFLKTYFFHFKSAKTLVKLCANEVITIKNNNINLIGEASKNDYFDSQNRLKESSTFYTIKDKYKIENTDNNTPEKIDINDNESDKENCDNGKINKLMNSNMSFAPIIEKNKNLNGSANFGNLIKINNDDEKIQKLKNELKNNSTIQNIDDENQANNSAVFEKNDIEDVDSDVDKLNNKSDIKPLITFFAVGVIMFLGLSYFAKPL